MRKVDEILSLRASGCVTRMHTIPHVGSAQTIADHCAQAIHLLFSLHPGPSVSLIKAVLYHDAPERWTGDWPAPIKRLVPSLKVAEAEAEELFFCQHESARVELTDEEQEWLKAVDSLELFLWCGDQMMLGNTHAKIVQDRVVGYIKSTKTPDEVINFLNQYISRSFV